MSDRCVGVQIGPASFVDEGVDAVLDTLQQRVGVNAVFLGTVSWLGLKIGRSISWKIDGWPDHGVPEPLEVQADPISRIIPSSTGTPASPTSAHRTRRCRDGTSWRWSSPVPGSGG